MFIIFINSLTAQVLTNCHKRPASSKALMKPFSAIGSFGKSLHAFQLDHSMPWASGINKWAGVW